jgi:hypothetical protein
MFEKITEIKIEMRAYEYFRKFLEKRDGKTYTLDEIYLMVHEVNFSEEN